MDTVKKEMLVSTEEFDKAVAIRMTHDQLQDNIADLAITLGWQVFHPQTVETVKRGHCTPYKYATSKGFPDLVLAKKDIGIILIEVKSEKGDLSDDQKRWRQHIGDVICPTGEYSYYVLRPCDWMSNKVQEILERGWEIGVLVNTHGSWQM